MYGIYLHTESWKWAIYKDGDLDPDMDLYPTEKNSVWPNPVNLPVWVFMEKHLFYKDLFFYVKPFVLPSIGVEQ
jgi:hypothetical protein